MIHLGAIYLVVRDFAKSVDFYERLLQMPVSGKNMERFAQFIFEGHNISIMNGLFDAKNPTKTIHKGEYSAEYDDLGTIANAPNTHKFVLNMRADDLRGEHARLTALGVGQCLTPVKYVYNVAPYYYFQLQDPDGNVIEVTGDYTPESGEFE
jgi:lactoylglutathione lyase